MELQAKKAKDLFNARLRKHNLEQGHPERSGELSQGDVGKLISPDTVQIDQAMTKLFKNQLKKIDVGLIDRLADVLNVDPNFICGWPSEHDEDYQKLVINPNNK